VKWKQVAYTYTLLNLFCNTENVFGELEGGRDFTFTGLAFLTEDKSTIANPSLFLFV